MSTISHEDVGADLRRIVISGRLDTPGTTLVAPRLTELAGAPKKGVVVDLSGVEFLSSTGIAVLMTCAKAVKTRGGRLILVVGDTATTLSSLQATGVDQLIPVFKLRADAERAALS